MVSKGDVVRAVARSAQGVGRGALDRGVRMAFDKISVRLATGEVMPLRFASKSDRFHASTLGTSLVGVALDGVFVAAESPLRCRVVEGTEDEEFSTTTTSALACSDGDGESEFVSVKAALKSASLEALGAWYQEDAAASRAPRDNILCSLRKRKINRASHLGRAVTYTTRQHACSSHICTGRCERHASRGGAGGTTRRRLGRATRWGG